MKRDTRSIWWLGAGLALAGIGLGCQRDPLDRKVSAESPGAFSSWRARIETDSGLDLRRQAKTALDEIRINVAADLHIKRARGEPVAAGESIDDLVRKRVDGKPLREVLQLGFELRHIRLKTELAALEQAMNENAQLQTKPGDVESRQHLDGLRDRQAKRVAQYREDLAVTERDLQPLVAVSGRKLVDPVVERPDEMPVPVSKTSPGRK